MAVLEAGPAGITGHLGEALMNESSTLRASREEGRGTHRTRELGSRQLRSGSSPEHDYAGADIGLPAQREIHSVGYKSLCPQDFAMVSQRLIDMLGFHHLVQGL